LKAHLFRIQNVALQKSVEIIEFEHAKTGSRWSYMGDAADRFPGGSERWPIVASATSSWLERRRDHCLVEIPTDSGDRTSIRLLIYVVME
jgi:hypothetical protein